MPSNIKRFGRRFGGLHMHPAAPSVLPGHPENFCHQGRRKSARVAGEDWHSDVSCDPAPPMGSILYLTEVPPDGGGDTMFANMYLAYETLSEPIRKLIDGLSAIHDGEHVYRGRYGVDDTGKTFPRSEHPIVRTHPITGKKGLFVNRTFTTRIVGLRKHESDAILEMLYRHVETPEFCVRFKWQPNSIAFWDKPLRPASGAMGLLPQQAIRPSRHDLRRQAVLMRLFKPAGIAAPSMRR